MDNKKKLTDDELEKVAGGYDSDMFYEDHRKEVTDQPPKHETWLQKDKLDDIKVHDVALKLDGLIKENIDNRKFDLSL